MIEQHSSFFLFFRLVLHSLYHHHRRTLLSLESEFQMRERLSWMMMMSECQCWSSAELFARISLSRNDQLHIADQIVSINNIYFDSNDPTIVQRAQDLLIDSGRLSIELVLISRTLPSTDAVVPTLTNNGHDCVPSVSTPFHLDMVVSGWRERETKSFCHI